MAYRKNPSTKYTRKKQSSRKNSSFPYGHPRQIKPMLAERGSQDDIDRNTYVGQKKYDGTRAVIIKSGDDVVMRGRSWINDFAPLFPEIVAEIQQLPAENCVIDSEITFFKKSQDVFLTALASEETKKGYTAKAMVFDALYFENYNLKDLPFTDHQEILKDLVPDKLKHVDVVETVFKGKKALFKKIGRKGGEGIILKERQSPYREDARTIEWLKVKHWKADEAVIVGYTKGEGARSSTFGSVILAQQDKKGGWRSVGKTAGFDLDEIDMILKKMRKLKTLKSPLRKVDLTTDLKNKVVSWVKPEIVIEVKYLEMTSKGKFRMPCYLRIRTDKQAKNIVFNPTGQHRAHVTKP